MIMDLNAKKLNNFHYAEFSLKFFDIDEIVQNPSLNELVERYTLITCPVIWN